MKRFAILLFMLQLAACSNSNNMPINTAPMKPDPSSETDLKLDEAFECQSDRVFHGIVNGSRVKPKDTLAQKAVLLMVQKSYGRIVCTGAAISDHVVLTAAHCMKGASSNSVAVIFHPDMKCSSGYTPRQVIKATDFVIHPEYSGKADAVGDLALVQLSRPAPQKYIVPLYNGESLLNSDEVLMIGYGATKENGTDTKVLRKVEKKLTTEVMIDKKRIFFDQSGDSGGVCIGDSGGPLYIQSEGRYQVIGVNSVVAGDTEDDACHKFSTGVYIPPYLPWIQGEVQKMNSVN